MTYLQLCQRLARSCGITKSRNIPSAVTSQSGDLLDVVDWIQDAWREIQLEKETWRWMRSRFSVNTVASTSEYAYGDCTDSRLSATIDRFARWIFCDRFNAPKAYLTSGGVAGQFTLGFLQWDEFQSIYGLGTVQEGQPCHITIDPHNNIVLGPTPDDIYTVTGDYQMSPQEMTADDDVPEMPERFHLLIIYDAMRKYAGDQVAQEVMIRAVNEGGPLRSALIFDQLPKFRASRPLA